MSRSSGFLLKKIELTMEKGATTHDDFSHEFLLKFQHLNNSLERTGMEVVRLASRDLCHFKLVYDDRCPLVRRLAKIVKAWDRFGHFYFIGWKQFDPINAGLLAELDKCGWSLLLIDEDNERWSGPDAIPFILKNLPFGRIAAALYILPGTMWLTTWLYMLVSRSRRR
jgi:predicted DCC family thiol-disulfide oxidoreductase YuxK